MSNLSTYTAQDLVVMAESNGSHPECSQVPTAAISQELTNRILNLEEAVRVLAECVNFAVGPMCRVGLVGVVDHVDRKLESNPTARAAVEKARNT